MRAKTFRVTIVILFFLCALTALSRPSWKTIEIGEHTRRYFVVEPREQTKKSPVLFVFHGGGGNAQKASRLGFSKLAQSQGYLVVYPNAVGKHWQIGFSDHPNYDATIDEVQFVDTLLDRLAKEYDIDPKRIYATGASNGSMMSHLVGMKLSHRFCAIAPMIGGIPSSHAPTFNPKEPVAVLIIKGTADPLVPYNGGPVTIGRKSWGNLESTDRIVSLWREHNRCRSKEVVEALPDTSQDGCTVKKFSWKKGEKNTEVLLYRVEGGGHTVPGGKQYLPERFIGKVCHDFNAIDVLSDFFARHHK